MAYQELSLPLSGAKIMFVYHEFTYGGASKSLSFWVNALAESGAEVSVVTYRANHAPLYPLHSSVVTYGVKVGQRLPLLKRATDLLTVLRAVRRAKPDIIIGLMSVNSFYAYLVARLVGAAVIVSERGFPPSDVGVFSKLKMWAMNRADGAVFQTTGAMSFYSERLQVNSVVIPNAAESTGARVDFDARKPELAFFGRFENRHKRLDVLNEAFQIVLKTHPDLRLNYFGDGEDLDLIKRHCRKLNIYDNVTFWGSVSDVPVQMGKYKYFVLASDHEGVPNSLLEAMLSGMACVSTDCEPGGGRLLIENNVNGILVERGNPAALAGAICRLLEDHDLAKVLANNACKVADQFNPKKIQRQLVDYVIKFI